MNAIAQQMYSCKTADTNTCVRVGVAIVVYDGEKRILLERRSDCDMWGLPGGRIEPGESVLETANREAKEETGLTIAITRLLGIYSEPEERIVTFPDNVVQLVDILLEATIIGGELTCSSESSDLKFFPLLGLPSEPEIVPPARLPLKNIADGLCGVIC